MPFAMDKKSWIGDYDYRALCTPMLPWQNKERKLQFFPRDAEMAILPAALMGLQHAFAMVGGLITPPYVVMKFSVGFMDTDIQQYAIAAALIVSGICTIINCLQIPIPLGPKKFYLGTGCLSVIGTSFTMLPIFESAIAQMKADGTDAYDAYGKMLGTVMLCSFLEIFLSFVPPDKLRKMFPPIVSGVTVMLIGVSLTGTGMKYWGGGAVCAEMAWKGHSQVAGLVGFPRDDPAKVDPIPGPMCTAGEVVLGYGSPELIGLGFSVLIMLVLVECFGSPFMKNCNVVIALLFGYFVAGVSQYCVDVDDGNGGTKEQCLDYVTDAKIKSAEGITFLWVETFDVGFYGPAVFPLLIAFIVTTVETIGDIGATYDASHLSRDGDDYTNSIQGGLLADGVFSFFSAICTSMPNTTFSQNNGVITLTKCAARRAGVACGIWLVFMGILSKIAGIITSIPDCVLGGMTIFLFCNVFVSGIKVVASANLQSRRNVFILAVSMGVGIGVAMMPHVFNDMRASPYSANFWPCASCSDGEKAVRNGILIFLSTPYCIGTVLALLLNGILPSDPVIEGLEAVEPTKEPKAMEA
eukprot:CAMPEP_0183818248 /NCGR_PEP_ID=MMETSP0803_2-20130417/61944_1 /TAXON_ID=195967 /ORGANISM="Crustomastix stigmata, Strain CCMP3273" /LENGTH=580 /DNA_ID=CAMNT_0026063137 /DNA_START=17 /DNA_END=1759 /DNA_ORIENTATION=-